MTYKILIILLFFFSLPCGAEESKIPIAPNSSEVLIMKLENSYKKGMDGIPEILKVLTEGLENHYTLASHASMNHSINYLYKLGKSGIYHKEELPLLIEALKKQIHINDTYKTAELIRIITRVDVGYNKDFISQYSLDDEEERQEMIKEWEMLLPIEDK